MTFTQLEYAIAVDSLTEHSSVVQVLVNAKGKNNSKTLCPFSSESVTWGLSLAYKVKSGAISP